MYEYFTAEEIRGRHSAVAPRFFFRVAHVNNLRIIIMDRRTYIKTSLKHSRVMH